MKLILRYGLFFWIAVFIALTFLWVQPAKDFPGNGHIAKTVIFHVPAAMLTVIWFAAGGFFAWKYLKNHKSEDDIKSYVSLEIGMLFSVIATVTGSIYAYSAWNHAWNWDPRETSMLAQMMIYLAYFALRSAIPDADKRGKATAVYALYALATVPFLLFLMPRLPMLYSSHPSDTLWKPSGLALDYRITLYGMMIGYLWLSLRIFKAFCKIELLKDRNEELDGFENDTNNGAAAYRVAVRISVPVEDRNEDNET